MLEFEIKNKQFKATKLTAFQQLHVTKRLLPIFSGVTTNLSALSGGEINNTPDNVAAMLGSLTTSLSSLKDEDLDSVINTALSVVSTRVGNNWTSLMSGGVLKFDNLSLFEMIKITVEVIKDNLTDFFTEIQEESSNMLTTQA